MKDLPTIITVALKVNFSWTVWKFKSCCEEKAIITAAENAVEKQCLEAAEVFCLPVK